MTEKDIPLYKVRANQLGIFIAIALAIILQYPWLVAIVWLVQILNRLLGPGANAFIIVFELITKPIYGTKKMEAEELIRFNHLIIVILLIISLVCFGLSWTLAGYIIAGIVGFCALLAVFGFCIGCTVYFQFKKFKALRQK